MYNGQKIGEVEIRHSRKCATVWGRVRNLTGATAQVKEAIVLYSDSNGNGRAEYWYPTVDTIGNNNYGWSNQYRDRASFSAKGGIFYEGAWRYAETPRTVAWVQYIANYADNPYACNHTQNWPCQRWRTLPNGLSETYYYGIDVPVAYMPASNGGTIDVSGDVRFMFNEFNDIPGSSPFFYETLYSNSDVHVYAYYEEGIKARAGGHTGGDGDYYTWGELKLSTATFWDDQDDTRATLCHEIDHLMGLAHVWWDDSQGIDNVGSKATCIGMSSPSGPRIDDTSALGAVYSGVVP
jgi:hypothetical protein